MTAGTPQDLMRQADSLSPDDQLRLAEYLVSRARTTKARLPRRWQDLCGIAPNLLGGEDAQEWVSRGRRESDEHRKAQLKQ